MIAQESQQICDSTNDEPNNNNIKSDENSTRHNIHQDDLTKYLRFGDLIFLSPTDGQSRYLAARSSIEQSVFMIQTGEIPVNEYPNTGELVFCLHPSIMHKAAFKLDEFMQEGELTNEAKLNMLKRRVQAEEEANQESMRKYLGNYVTIGSQVQLYHIFSKTYVKATRGKNSQSSNLFYLKLSNKASSGTHFKMRIDPFLNFKMEGEKISFEDTFFFSSNKFGSVITNISLPQIIGLNQEKLPAGSGEVGKINQPTTTNAAAIWTMPCTLEILKCFDQFEGGHRRDEVSAFRATLLTPYGTTISVQKQRQLYWGDLVRVTHILPLTKKVGTLFAEINVAGTNREILFETMQGYSHTSPDTFSSIFQIIPPLEIMLGKEIKLDKSEGLKYTRIRLRHYLSGCYLNLVDKTVALGSNCEDLSLKKKLQASFTQNLMWKQISSQQSENMLAKEEQQLQLKQSESSPSHQRLSNLREDKVIQAKESFLQQQTTQQVNNDFLGLATFNKVKERRDYEQQETNIKGNGFRERSFTDASQLTISSKTIEDSVLTTTSVFNIQCTLKGNKFIIDKESAPMLAFNTETAKIEGNSFLNSDNFTEIFQSVNALSREIFKISAFSSMIDKKPDYFYFQKVNPEDISDVMCVHSRLFHLSSSINSTLLSMGGDTHFALIVEELHGIVQWLLGNPINLDPKLQENRQPKKRRQGLLRELGVIDMVVKLLGELQKNGYLKVQMADKSPETTNLVQIALKILQLSCADHYSNSIYTYQWYDFFKKIILNEKISEIFRFDIFVNQLFEKTQMNVGARADLTRIIDAVDFTRYNTRALNLMTGFCRSNYFREKKELEQIIETLFFNYTNRSKVFRKLVKDSSEKVCLEIETEKLLEISDNHAQNFSKQYQYLGNIVLLVIEICKGGGLWLIQAFVDEFFPRDLVIELFQDTQASTVLSSVFLDLFLSSYIARDFQNIQETRTPAVLQVSDAVSFSSEALQKYMQLRLQLVKKYLFTGSGGINIKTLITTVVLEFKEQINKDIELTKAELAGTVVQTGIKQTAAFSSENKYFLMYKAALRQAMFFIKRDFYSDEDIEYLNSSILDVLEQAHILIMLLGQKSKQLRLGKDDPSDIIGDTTWLELSVSVLQEILMSRENSYLSSFYHSKIDKEKEQTRRLELKYEAELVNATRRSFKKKNAQNQKFQARIQAEIIFRTILKERYEKFFAENHLALYTTQMIDVLHAWMNFGMTQLNRSISRLIFSMFCHKERFAQSVEDTLLITQTNLRPYEKLIELYYEMRFLLTDLSRLRSIQLQEEANIVLKLGERIRNIVREVFVQGIEFKEILQTGNSNKRTLILVGQETQRNPQLTFRGGPGEQFLDEIEGVAKSRIATGGGSEHLSQIGKKPKYHSKHMYDVYDINGLKEGSKISCEVDENESSDSSIQQENIVQNFSPRVIGSYFSSEHSGQYPLTFTSRHKFKSPADPKFKFSYREMQDITKRDKSNNNNNNQNAINEDDEQKQLEEDDIHEERSVSELVPAVYTEIYPEYILDINSLAASQKLLNCTGLIEEIIEILVNCKERKVKNTFTLFCDCLAVLGVYVTGNSANVEYLLARNEFLGKREEGIVNKTLSSRKGLGENEIGSNGLLRFLLQREEPEIIELTLLLLRNACFNNERLLLNVEQSVDLATLLGVLQSRFKAGVSALIRGENDGFCFLFLQFLPSIFLLQGQALPSNQLFLVKQLLKISFEINGCLSSAINSSKDAKVPKGKDQLEVNIVDKLLGQDQSSIDTEEQEDNEEVDWKIPVPEEICFLTSFLRTFRLLAKNSSSFVNNFIRQLLTVQQISELLQNLDTWWTLKTELLLYLTEAYLNQKYLEDAETVQLHNIFEVVLSEEISNFNSYFVCQKTTFQKAHFESTDVKNLFQETHIGTAPYAPFIQIPYETAYYQFIILGVLRSLRFFLKKQPEDPSLMVLKLVNQYSRLIRELPDIFGGHSAIRKMLPKMTGKQSRSSRKKTYFQKEASPGKNPVSFIKEEPEADSLSQVSELCSQLDEIIKRAAVQNFAVKPFEQTAMKKEQRSAYNLQKQLLAPPIQVPEKGPQSLQVLSANIIALRSKDKDQFLECMENYLEIASNVKGVSIEVRVNSLNLLRHIASTGQNTNSESPRMENEEEEISVDEDLCSIGFTRFLCDAVVREATPDMKGLYLDSLVDFLGQVKGSVAASFIEYMIEDDGNLLLKSLKHLLQDQFDSYLEFKKALMQDEDSNTFPSEWNAIYNQRVVQSQSIEISEEFQAAIKSKLDKCSSIMELVKLCCRNHTQAFQSFFRSQTDKTQKEKKTSINFLNLFSNLFSKFTKNIDSNSLQFGIDLLETLVSLIEGPCIQNQQELVSSQILENLEDIMLSIFDQSQVQGYDKESFQIFKRKIVQFCLALFEGSGNRVIIGKVGKFINPSLLYNQMAYQFEEYSNCIALLRNKHLGIYLELTGNSLPDEVSQQLKSIESAATLERFIVEKYGKIRNNKKKREIALSVRLKANSFLSFSQLCLSLLLNLQFEDPVFRKRCEEAREGLAPSVLKQLILLKQSFRSIEVVNQFGSLQKVFFPSPLISDYLSSTKQLRFLEDVNRDSANDKILGLLMMENYFMDEMKHFLSLNARGISFRLGVLQRFKTSHLVMIIISNFFVLTGFDQDIPVLSRTVGLIQLASSCLTWLLWAVMELPLDYMSSRRNIETKLLRQLKEEGRQQKAKARSKLKIGILIIYDLMQNSSFIFLTTKVCFSILGLAITKIFYTLLLMEVIDRSPILRNVIKAVTRNSRQLLLTGMLGCILLLFYSSTAYYSYLSRTVIFKDDDTLDICHSPFDCFIFMLGQGLRQGGGVGDIIKMPDPYDYIDYYGRFAYDLTFYLLINVLWLNIIFGIIVDSFAELRDAKKEKDKDQENICYICSIGRDKFENEGLSFAKHCDKEHPLWNYMFYIIHLRLKKEKNFTGTEAFVMNKISKDDITWFPIGKSIRLLQIQGESQFTSEQKLQNSVDLLHQKIASLENKIAAISAP